MPRRDDTPEIKQGNSRETSRSKREKLTLIAGNYSAIATEVKKLGATQDKYKKEIKEYMEDPDIYEKNGNHKEVTLPAGDGKTEYFVQVQIAESVSAVDNIIGLMREKLGEKAENFITTVEVIHPNAIESMYNQGLITEKNVTDWTTTKQVERLIVKTK